MSDGDSTTADPRQQIGQVISELWLLVLLRGILLVILGGYALAQPGLTLLTLTQVIAVFAILDGGIAIAAGIMGAAESRGWTIVRGVLGILAGGFVLGHPLVVAGFGLTVIVLIIAFQTIACGVFEIMVAIRERKQIEGEGWLILSGVLALIFGAILLVSPFVSGLIMISILGAFTIVFGVTLIVNSFRMRKLGKAMAPDQNT